MIKSANLGFPRIGAKRELKKAVEAFWKGELSEAELITETKRIKLENWQMQDDAGIDHIPSNDFTMYDHVLDTICMVGAVPERYNAPTGQDIDINTFFAMARGKQADGIDVTAMEMTKWFDTNYHYIVPEFVQNQKFNLQSNKAIEEFLEAKEADIHTRPVILGPVSFLLLGKMKSDAGNNLDLLDNLLPVYKELLTKLADAGADWIQIDEPCLVLDLTAEAKSAYKQTYVELSTCSELQIMLTTYFGDLRDNLELATTLSVAGLHVDLVRAPEQLDAVLANIGNKTLSLGVVDGRNIWLNNFDNSLGLIAKAVDKVGNDNLIIAPSCSLLHTPVDLDSETELSAELKNWLAFSKQKLDEIVVLVDTANGADTEAELTRNRKAIASRDSSTLIHKPAVKKRVANISEDLLSRNSEYTARAKTQKALGLPLLPTTTIGSFPQTQAVRKARAEYKKGTINREQYEEFLKAETEKTIRFQEKIDIDVLVHGEYERNDMVEYFGEKLEGFAFSKFGWVQSYGSRCVKPPIIFGDVERTKPMTVYWTEYAQSLTDRYVKGMLTGPVTILQWSFVRDDQPDEVTCKQIAFAIRDEVIDLEKAGIKIIQIDEPAIREGLPLRNADQKAYLKWAVDSFRISAAGVADKTQIHTHMCYSEFNDMIDSIADMDADVISMETSRSDMELLDAFVSFKYPNEIGPGVYDIHSPRVPNVSEMEDLLKKALNFILPEQLWVNPDCGLKTRGWQETDDALVAMVTAAKNIRQAIAEGSLKVA